MKVLRAVAILVVAAAAVVGVLQAGDDRVAGERGSLVTDAGAYGPLRDAPAPLAALRDQASQLLGGGRAAFEARVAALEGVPVVINVWGSSCPPCRRELPLFQRAAVQLERDVAFVGINAKDPERGARELLGTYPLPYPSYVDPAGDALARTVDAGVLGYPATIFLDARGRQRYVQQGEYQSVAALLDDISRYLGVSRSG